MSRMKQKKWYVLLIVSLLVLALSACGEKEIISTEKEETLDVHTDNFSGGSGTEKDPYLLGGADDLRRMAQVINDYGIFENPYVEAFYRLEGDVYLDGQSWTPILRLTGGLDGNGHTISGFSIASAKDGLYYGLIAELQGVIQNLTISDAEIQVDRSSSYVGAIAGNVLGGSLINCRTTDTVRVSGNFEAGGLAGSVSSGIVYGSETGNETGVRVNVVEDCVNAAAVEATGSVGAAGGIAASLGADVRNCVNTGDISAPEGDAGGIAYALHGHVEDCRNEGTITANGYAGGVCGSFDDGALNRNMNDPTIYLLRCVNTGDVSSVRRTAAGICGSIRTGTISDCSNSGTISCEAEAGGIFGFFQTSAFGTAAEEVVIANCTNSGSVSSQRYPAGGIGSMDYTSGALLRFENCVNNGEVRSETAQAGGILGSIFGSGTESGGAARFVECSNSGDVTGGEYVGGILGRASVAGVDGDPRRLILDFAGCNNTGNLTALRNNAYLGGILGGCSDNQVVLSFSDCDNTGDFSSDAGNFQTSDLCGNYPNE